jgi:hypothetical protein
MGQLLPNPAWPDKGGKAPKAAIPASRRLPVEVDDDSARNDPRQQVTDELQL